MKIEFFEKGQDEARKGRSGKMGRVRLKMTSKNLSLGRKRIRVVSFEKTQSHQEEKGGLRRWSIISKGNGGWKKIKSE